MEGLFVDVTSTFQPEFLILNQKIISQGIRKSDEGRILYKGTFAMTINPIDWLNTEAAIPIADIKTSDAQTIAKKYVLQTENGKLTFVPKGGKWASFGRWWRQLLGADYDFARNLTTLQGLINGVIDKTPPMDKETSDKLFYISRLYNEMLNIYQKGSRRAPEPRALPKDVEQITSDRVFQRVQSVPGEAEGLISFLRGHLPAIYTDPIDCLNHTFELLSGTERRDADKRFNDLKGWADRLKCVCLPQLSRPIEDVEEALVGTPIQGMPSVDSLNLRLNQLQEMLVRAANNILVDLKQRIGTLRTQVSKAMVPEGFPRFNDDRLNEAVKKLSNLEGTKSLSENLDQSIKEIQGTLKEQQEAFALWMQCKDCYAECQKVQKDASALLEAPPILRPEPKRAVPPLSEPETREGTPAARAPTKAETQEKKYRAESAEPEEKFEVHEVSREESLKESSLEVYRSILDLVSEHASKEPPEGFPRLPKERIDEVRRMLEGLSQVPSHEFLDAVMSLQNDSRAWSTRAQYYEKLQNKLREASAKQDKWSWHLIPDIMERLKDDKCDLKAISTQLERMGILETPEPVEKLVELEEEEKGVPAELVREEESFKVMEAKGQQPALRPVVSRRAPQLERSSAKKAPSTGKDSILQDLRNTLQNHFTIRQLEKLISQLETKVPKDVKNNAEGKASVYMAALEILGYKIDIANRRMTHSTRTNPNPPNLYAAKALLLPIEDARCSHEQINFVFHSRK